MEYSALRMVGVFGAFLLGSSAIAGLPFSELLENHEIQILRVTSDAVEGHVDVRLYVDGNSNILTFRQYSNEGKMTEFKLNQLSNGAVLLNESGHDVIKLASSNLNIHSGGSVDMVYLSNGIVNSYETFQMELVPASSQWYLQVNGQSGHQEITEMFLKGKTLFGQVIGIEDVVVK